MILQRKIGNEHVYQVLHRPELEFAIESKEITTILFLKNIPSNGSMYGVNYYISNDLECIIINIFKKHYEKCGLKI